MVVKLKLKVKIMEFEKFVVSYVECVNNGELILLKVVQYCEFGDDKGYFIVVDEEQDLMGMIWVNDLMVLDKFCILVGKEIMLVMEEGEEVLEFQVCGMKYKFYFFVIVVEEEGGYLLLDNEDLEEIMFFVDVVEVVLEIVIVDQ